MHWVRQSSQDMWAPPDVCVTHKTDMQANRKFLEESDQNETNAFLAEDIKVSVCSNNYVAVCLHFCNISACCVGEKWAKWGKGGQSNAQRCISDREVKTLAGRALKEEWRQRGLWSTAEFKYERLSQSFLLLGANGKNSKVCSQVYFIDPVTFTLNAPSHFYWVKQNCWLVLLFLKVLTASAAEEEE